MSPSWVLGIVSIALLAAKGDDSQEVKLSECPPAVRKTIQAEAKGALVETVAKERDDDGDIVYWAELPIGGNTYAIGVLEDGTLSEMNLAVDDNELPLDRCPAPVRATFKAEAFGAKVEAVTKDIKYGVPIFEAAIMHKDRAYVIVIAQDGTLVEKVLVIDDEETELSACPAPVQHALQEQAKGGAVHEVTRSTGIGRPTFEAEIEVKGKVYLVEVDETGLLLSKSLEASE